MREIRQSGSEGGETGQPVFPTPIFFGSVKKPVFGCLALNKGVALGSDGEPLRGWVTGDETADPASDRAPYAEGVAQPSPGSRQRTLG